MKEYFTSGLLSESKLVLAVPGELKQILLLTDGVNNAKLVCYDVSSVSEINNSNVLAALVAPGANLFKQLTFPPLLFKAGLYCLLSGTGANYVVILSRES